MTDRLLDTRHPDSAVRDLVCEVSSGAAAVAHLVEFASFIDRHSEAFCTRSTWLRLAARHLPGEPVTIIVRDGHSGPVVALAALARSRRRGVRRIEMLGGELNDYGQFHYDSEQAARCLAAAIVGWVVGEHRAWSLLLEQLPNDDPVVGEVLRRLPRAAVTPGPPMPQIKGLGTDYLISRNRRRKAANAINRVESAGLAWEQVLVEDREQLDRWLPAIIAVRRQRDHGCGRRSHLDDPAMRAFYESVVRDACESGRLTVDLLLVAGEVAGYSVAVDDGDVRRMLDGRVAHEFQLYRGAMVSDLVAVTRASADPDVSTFDWLRGRTDAKFGNHEVRRTGLRATSHAGVERLDAWDSAARERAKSILPDAVLRRIAQR